MSDIPDPDSRIARVLIGWFGLFQTIHILVNLRALAQFKRGQDTFPANPPEDGWADETQATFTGMAGIDTVAGIITLAFIFDYHRDGELWPWLGTIALTIANYSATIYSFPTREAGAWDDHPLAYWGLYVAYLPVVALSVLYVLWNVRGDV